MSMPAEPTAQAAAAPAPPPAAPPAPPPELSPEALGQRLETVNQYMGSAGQQVDRSAQQAVSDLARYGAQSQQAAQQAAQRQQQTMNAGMAAYNNLAAQAGWSPNAIGPGRANVERAYRRNVEDVQALGDIDRWLSGRIQGANQNYFNLARAGAESSAQNARLKISNAFNDAYTGWASEEEARRRKEEEARKNLSPEQMRFMAVQQSGVARQAFLDSAQVEYENAKTPLERLNAAKKIAELNKLTDYDWQSRTAENLFSTDRGAGVGAALFSEDFDQATQDAALARYGSAMDTLNQAGSTQGAWAGLDFRRRGGSPEQARALAVQDEATAVARQAQALAKAYSARYGAPPAAPAPGTTTVPPPGWGRRVPVDPSERPDTSGRLLGQQAAVSNIMRDYESARAAADRARQRAVGLDAIASVVGGGYRNPQSEMAALQSLGYTPSQAQEALGISKEEASGSGTAQDRMDARLKAEALVYSQVMDDLDRARADKSSRPTYLSGGQLLNELQMLGIEDAALQQDAVDNMQDLMDAYNDALDTELPAGDDSEFSDESYKVLQDLINRRTSAVARQYAQAG